MSEQSTPWRVTYTPGDWLVLAGGSSVVVLQPASGQWSGLINSIWESVAAAESADDLTDRLNSFGLDQMASLAWLHWDDSGVHATARGEISAVDHLSGDPVADHDQRLQLDGIKQLRLQMSPDQGSQPPLELPCVEGTVIASSIVLDPQRPKSSAGDQGQAWTEQDLDDYEPTQPVVPSSPSPPVLVPEETFTVEPVEGPLVFAVFCPLHHANPPESRTCRLCHSTIAPQVPQQVPRPVLAVLLPSTSGPVDVDRPVLIGRSPSTSRTSSDQLPWLLTVPSPSHDISRTHLEVAPHGWQLRATDLNSTNGTILIRPRGRPERMPAGVPVEVAPGCVLDLGDGVTIAIDNPQS